MVNPDGDKLIFGRYTREECGLPPRGLEGWRRAITPFRVCVLVAATAAAAWLGGEAVARWREHWLALLPGRVATADIGEVPGLLQQGRMFAAALPDNQRMRRDLAVAAVTAAERMPRRLGYYATAAGLFRGLSLPDIPAGPERFATGLTAAGVFAEIGDFPTAFSTLNQAEKELEGIPEPERRSYRLLLINAQAYFLADADESKGGNPEKALELARLMVSSRDSLPGGGHASANAALLDTMATAFGKTGETEKAKSAQSLALGLARPPGLDVYLRHYDEFNKGAHRQE